jgi:ATP-dependent Zn protease
MNDIIALNDNHIKSVKLVKNNEQIYVLVDKGYVNKYSELLTGQYSKFINITDESGITIEQKSNFYYQFIFIVIIFIFMITSIIISYRKRLLNKR